MGPCTAGGLASTERAEAPMVGASFVDDL